MFMKVLPMDFLGFPDENEFKYGKIRSIFSERSVFSQASHQKRVFRLNRGTGILIAFS